MRRSALAVLAVSVIAAAGCHGGNGPGGPSGTASSAPNNNPFSLPAGTLAFHAAPISPSAVRFITPLGNLNPPGHPTPTDHIYFYYAAPDTSDTIIGRRTEVFVPAAGVVSFVIGGQNVESKVMVSVTSTMWYYLDHVVPDIPVAVGTRFTDGQHLGFTGTTAYAIDLGVINFGLTHPGILDTAKYVDETIHGDAPLKYFDEPLRSQFYSQVQRIGGDLDGKYDFDVAGHLSGNWFNDPGGTFAISFAYNTYDPSQVRLSFGGLPLVGVYSIGPGEPDPANVTVATGAVRYTLTTSRTGLPLPGFSPTVGTVLVQMLTDSRIEIESFVGTLGSATFTSNAKFFVR